MTSAAPVVRTPWYWRDHASVRRSRQFGISVPVGRVRRKSSANATGSAAPAIRHDAPLDRFGDAAATGCRNACKKCGAQGQHQSNAPSQLNPCRPCGATKDIAQTAPKRLDGGATGPALTVGSRNGSRKRQTKSPAGASGRLSERESEAPNYSHIPALPAGSRNESRKRQTTVISRRFRPARGTRVGSAKQKCVPSSIG